MLPALHGGFGAVDGKDAAFERRSCGNGSKGPRYSDWAMTATSIEGQSLLIRRLISRPASVFQRD